MMTGTHLSPAMRTMLRNAIKGADLYQGMGNAARKAGGGTLMTMRLGTADEGIERFQPVRQTLIHELVEGPVDLQRRAQAIGPQLVENVIGAERGFRMVERPQHQPLVARQVGWNIVTMRHGALSCRTAARREPPWC